MNCDRCDSPVTGKRVAITLHADGKGDLQASFCSLGCATEWLILTPFKLREIAAADHPGIDDPEKHKALLATFTDD